MFSIFCNEGENGLLKFEIKIKLFVTISIRLYGSVHLTSLDKIQKIYECLLVAQIFYLLYTSYITSLFLENSILGSKR